MGGSWVCHGVRRLCRLCAGPQYVIKKMERAVFFAVGFPAVESALGGLLSKCLTV